MAIGFRVGSAVSRSNNVAPPILIPNTVQTGDFVAVMVTGTTSDISGATTPTGWTRQADGFVQSGSNTVSVIYYKIAQVSDPGTNFVFTVPGTPVSTAVAKIVLNLVAYSGVDTSVPVNISKLSAETSASTAHATPFVTTTASSWVLSGVADRGSPGSSAYTPGAGITKRSEVYGTGGGSVGCAIGDTAANTSAGLQNGGTWTGDVSLATANMFTLALNPTATNTPAGATVYANFINSILNSTIDWDTDAGIKAALVNSYTFSQTHQFFSSVSASQISAGFGYTAGGVALASKTTTTNTGAQTTKLSSNSVSWTASGGTIGPATGMVIYKDTGSAATSPLISYIDFGGSVSTTTGNTLQVDPDATYGWAFFSVTP